MGLLLGQKHSQVQTTSNISRGDSLLFPTEGRLLIGESQHTLDSANSKPTQHPWSHHIFLQPCCMSYHYNLPHPQNGFRWNFLETNLKLENKRQKASCGMTLEVYLEGSKEGRLKQLDNLSSSHRGLSGLSGLRSYPKRIQEIWSFESHSSIWATPQKEHDFGWDCRMLSKTVSDKWHTAVRSRHPDVSQDSL